MTHGDLGKRSGVRQLASVESGEKSKDSKDLKSHRDSNDPQIAGHPISSAANLYCQAAEG